MKTTPEENSGKEPKNTPHDKMLSLETHRNMAFLVNLFFKLKQETLGQMSRAKKLKQEFLARTSQLTAHNRVASVLLYAVKYGAQDSARIDLRPLSSVQELLVEINKFFPIDESNPLSASIIQSPNTFFSKRVASKIKKNESIKRSLSIPVNDLVAFLSSHGVTVPQFADKEIQVHVVGTSENGIPTALIYWIAGRPNKERTPSRLESAPRILRPGLV